MPLLKDKSYPDIPENVKGVVPPQDLLVLIPRELVKEFQAFVFEKKNDNSIKIAAINPKLPTLQHFIKERFGDDVEWFLVKEDDISFVLKHYPQNFQEEIAQLLKPEIKTNRDIVGVVDSLINYALAEKASDLHIEPRKNDSVVRFRIDGVLHPVLRLAPDVHPVVVSRLKILANLKIDEYRRPQDGRIELEKFPDLSLRISIVPILYGEKVSLRILDDSTKNLVLRELGFSEEQERILLKNIEKPFGMIINSGPTGSGKTTTLYGLLSLLPKERINITTLEDPVEYSLDGANQIQVDPRMNLTFTTGLRSILRQDPDVIMVGEIRDSETAIMASEAALTGHLVLTTIHTNDAPSVFPRLLEMNVEDFVIASIVNVVIGQRLLRRTCSLCAQKTKLSENILKKIAERKDILEALEATGKNINELAKHQFLVGAGCETCKHTGYRGRIGMFEVLEIGKEIHDLILEHASAERIKVEVKKLGFQDMISDGIDKVFKGLSTFEEVLRTTRSIV